MRCDSCNGHGYHYGEECLECNGTGYSGGANPEEENQPMGGEEAFGPWDEH